ncbi:metal-dependent hydrolase [Liberibacter crescens BT-1]|uniref:Endoribonuclease YbeY n=1 Tax=Liberibacter crescens (strain BT-1) TaxID=1215343 RepID=L0EUU3_LIBCB|nr:rRNA maturation RNase YbeY [Liberibacter crescens]AGA64151.1 metal-dependent hydrolase [Liberibacter crescens BT-1]AMC12419.1 metal-dependent hydrolase [Liberibacter crescens]
MNVPQLYIQIAVESTAWLRINNLYVFCDKIINEALRFLFSKDRPFVVERAIEVSFLFTDSISIRELNSIWRGVDKSTNVLSFPSNFCMDSKCLSVIGDIVLAYEVIEQEAIEFQKTFENHLTHLIIHGFLHLLGYNHVNDRDACIMEELETCILANLGFSDPYEGYILF